MKRRNIFAWGVALVTAVLLHSCYEDKGHYSYSFDTLNKIDTVVFTPTAVEAVLGPTIELTQPLTDDETKRVEVKVTQSLAAGTDNLDFKWIRSYTDASGATVSDTLNTPGYMDVVIPHDRLITYTVLLEVRDKETDLAYYTNLVVKTRPIFQNSLFVLHQQNDVSKLGNVEIVGADVNIRPDVYTTIHPDATDNPFANTVRLGFASYYELRAREIKQTLAVMNRDGSSALYDPFGMTVRTGTQLPPWFVLPNTSTPFIADKLIATGDISSSSGYKLLISSDGRFYVADQYLSFHVPGGGLSEEDYPLHLTPDNYKVTAGTIMERYMLLWDAKNNRFIYQAKDNPGYDESSAPYMQSQQPVLDANVSFSTLSAELSPAGKTAVYAFTPYKENYDESNAFFIFKDGDGRYYLYELQASQSSDKDGKKSAGMTRGKDDGGENTAFTIVTAKELQGFAPSNDRSVIFDFWFSSNYVFYANGSNFYRYNTSNGDSDLMYSAPSGYNITLAKLRNSDSGNYNGDLGRYISLGLWNGTKGAVAEVYFSTSADVESVLPSATTLYEGFGRILDFQFANEYFYQLPDYQK